MQEFGDINEDYRHMVQLVMACYGVFFFSSFFLWSSELGSLFSSSFLAHHESV